MPAKKQNEEPKCKNCWENGIKTEANHEAFSNKCKRSKVATAELLQLATEKGISIALVQEPYVGNQGILKQNPGTKVIQCTVGRQKPVKAAIIVFGDKVEVLHDPQLTETESRPIKNRQNEAGYHLDLLRRRRGHRAIYHQNEKACKNLGTENLIIAGDINAWSHWWEAREKTGGAKLTEISWTKWASTSSTQEALPPSRPRGDRICSSIVDVTACSSPLIDTTRTKQTGLNSVYSSEILFRSTGLRKGRTNERPEDLEANSREYIAAIQEVCEEIFPKIGQRKTKRIPWWTAELSALKRRLAQKRRIRNAAPTRKAVIEDYLTAKTIYTQKAEIAQTESWKEYCTTQDKESMWDKVYRVIRNKKVDCQTHC
ncbi:hypothetical protein EVAR_85557_1 [Eumeta japonica]|uniref:Retrovirus-related Pol polyprotein from type-1 retrotransposable element R1 n=1 Tax=Eumeta variegata TaxID=151549 RepID=A0A4C1VAZ6_EUMVA|nr:hypothetical protein EVAR_85557_1 [Eumeta japonica]